MSVQIVKWFKETNYCRWHKKSRQENIVMIPSFLPDRSVQTVLSLSRLLLNQGLHSADPEQTAPGEAVWSGSTLFAIPYASFGHCKMVKTTLFKCLDDYNNYFWCPNVLYVYGTDKHHSADGLWVATGKFLHNMSLFTRKPVFGVCDHVRLKPACSADETS